MTQRVCALIMISGFAFCLMAQSPQGTKKMIGFKFKDRDESGRIVSIVYGDSVRIPKRGSVIEITQMKIETFDGNEQPEMMVTAPFCYFDKEKKVATSESGIRIAHKNIVITGEGFDWQAKSKSFEIKKNAKVVIKNAESDLGATKGE